MGILARLKKEEAQLLQHLDTIRRVMKRVEERKSLGGVITMRSRPLPDKSGKHNRY